MGSSKTWDERFRDHLAAAMEKAKLKNKDLAERCGVSPQAVTEWLSGRSKPDIEHLRQISAATGASVSFLVSDVLTSKTSLELLSRELGSAVGYRRLKALLELPQPRLRREIDAILGSFLLEERDRKTSTS